MSIKPNTINQTSARQLYPQTVHVVWRKWYSHHTPNHTKLRGTKNSRGNRGHIFPCLLCSLLYRKRGVGKWPTLTTSLTYLLITLIALPSKFSKSELISRITYIVYLSLLFLFTFHVYKCVSNKYRPPFPLSLFFPSTTRKNPIKVRSPSSSFRA